MTDCAKTIYKNGGLTHFYKGVTTSIYGIVLYRGLYFGLYDTGKVILFPDFKKASIISLWAFA